MPPELNLLVLDRGSVTAPAGCGKTQLIADTLGLHNGPKPILILTHTNAGAAALRARLQRNRVRSSSYRVATLDGFAMRLIGTFPLRSGHNPRILEINDARNDYPAIRTATSQLLHAGHISDVLRATYSQVIVDEYQDCNLIQHAIVDALAMVLPTVVLGDPMQAIFGFSGNQLVEWQTHVEAQFPAAGALGIPWRWRNAGTEPLGRWLLKTRAQLQGGQGVDLRGAPGEVQWVQMNAANAAQQRRAAAQTRTADQEETVLIIGDARNPRGRHQFTSQTPGATSVEAVDLSDLVSFARRFNITRADALGQLVNFAAEIMTQVGAANLLARVETIRQGRARTPPTLAEVAAVDFATAPSISAALHLIQQLEDQAHARVFRPEMLHCFRSAMHTAASSGVTFLDGVLQARERNRHFGRPVSRRAVGSTLLLKGLEADVAIILYPELMNATNLYVALTRGARRLIVCSTTAVINPLA
ncbi:UvrD-helicase domain-containing protein [Methylomonas fluvii]|uniref:DNA 3'-5' helicase II n=1 Tax=Methylomonas fluvii TaxID=1854564 RepID=A0ABR9DEK1_9GAMM|nr:UvrD-helicase domain-containing protein [Methylomonas fluvii]MBD9361530.1 UvrD-helicase domain-containing protein [Methylomonas fluvii]